MSHEITERDSVFTVRKPAWHGIGTVFEDYPTREEAQKLVHPWEPETEPLYRKMISYQETDVAGPDGEPITEPVEVYEEVKSAVLNVRSDDLGELGVVSDTYTLVKNTELWDVAEAIQGSGGDVLYETGGSLKGGAKVWVLLRLTEPLVVKGDPHGEVIPYYALQNSHDGLGAFRGQALNTRIVCDNTSLMADIEARARGTEFNFQHTTNVSKRIEEARKALAGWRDSIDRWQQFTEVMIGARITDDQAREFMEEFIPKPPAKLISERVEANIEQARQQWWGILNGQTCQGIERTAHGLVQASIEYHQHYRVASTRATGFSRAYLDRSKLTANAVKLAKEVARV